MDRATENGGFPLPLEGEPVRQLSSRHDACDAETRVRLPRAVPARAVRRVVCQGCAQPYEPARVEDVPELAAGASRYVRWVGPPIAALAVVGALYAVQGGGDDTASDRAIPAPGPAAATDDRPAKREPRARAQVPGDAQLISESTFQLALPPGWERSTPSGGATFAAVAPGGAADAMLWIERDPKLDFASFEARSLAQLESLAGSAGVVERNPGPTPETTSITIAPTSAPPGAPNYEVLLRASGNYWYYLATTSQPGAGAEVTDAVRVIQGSFLPQGAAK